jgi:hypothetical protein
MINPVNLIRKHRAASFVIGFLFLILAVPAQTGVRWLFVLGGLLAIGQGLVDWRRAVAQEGD